METEETTPALYLVQTSDFCWGKGTTLEEAIKEARNAGSKVTRTGRKVDYVVIIFDSNVKAESVYVDGMGSARWEVEVAEEPRNFRQGMLNEWIWRDGKNTSLLNDNG